LASVECAHTGCGECIAQYEPAAAKFFRKAGWSWKRGIGWRCPEHTPKYVVEPGCEGYV